MLYRCNIAGPLYIYKYIRGLVRHHFSEQYMSFTLSKRLFCIYDISFVC